MGGSYLSLLLWDSLKWGLKAVTGQTSHIGWELLLQLSLENTISYGGDQGSLF